MIEGPSIHCNVGPAEVLRSPFIKLAFRYRAMVSRVVVVIPDPEDEV